jgi:hypothetical protein
MSLIDAFADTERRRREANPVQERRVYTLMEIATWSSRTDSHIETALNPMTLPTASSVTSLGRSYLSKIPEDSVALSRRTIPVDLPSKFDEEIDFNDDAWSKNLMTAWKKK